MRAPTPEETKRFQETCTGDLSALAELVHAASEPEEAGCMVLLAGIGTGLLASGAIIVDALVRWLA